ncbi:MAG: HAD hydrolase family protein [Lachnospiraceae bacterium]|jgi:hydroxymethylpyrimidine pyrophosphatase-like HAD family hydrolase|nr:HAD hydrolase family protein [Lachnospiraceae bacterium]
MKILGSDYDGTLKQEGSVTEEDLLAIRKFRAEGNRFGIITGRSVSMIRYELEAWKIPVDFLVCSNGGVIAGADYRILNRFDIGLPVAMELIADLEQDKKVMFGISDGDRFGTLQEGKLSQIPEDPLLTKGQMDAGEILACGIVNSFFVRCPDTEETFALCRRLSGKYGGRLSFYPNRDVFDVVAAGVSKSAGAMAVMRHFGETCHVIGDGYNDLPMIRDFQGFSVESAPEDVKAEAVKIYRSVGECLKELMK